MVTPSQARREILRRDSSRASISGEQRAQEDTRDSDAYRWGCRWLLPNRKLKDGPGDLQYPGP
jgi:hypothetical protein